MNLVSGDLFLRGPLAKQFIWAVSLRPAPAMFWLDAHILGASSSTV